MRKSSVVLIGCGDIGSALAGRLLARDWSVTGVRRQVDQLPAGVDPLPLDIEHDDLDDLAAFDYAVVTLTPAEFSESGYQRIYRDAWARVLNALARRPPRRVLFVSSTSVYHQNDGSWVDETSATEPSSFSGQAIVVAEAMLRDSGLAHSILRCGGIYGPGRDMLLRRVREGRCTPSEPVRHSNRIQRDDVAGFLEYLLLQDQAQQALDDCYVVVDDEPAPIQQVERWLAEQMDVAYRQGGEVPKRGGNRRCSNARLKQSGYQLCYPDFRAGYSAMLSLPDPE